MKAIIYDVCRIRRKRHIKIAEKNYRLFSVFRLIFSKGIV